MSAEEIGTDRLIRTFIKIRAKRAQIEHAYNVEDADLKKQQRRVENELLSRAAAKGTKNFITSMGTAYRHEDKHVSIADEEVFNAFVKQTGDLRFYEQRPHLGHVTKYQAAHDGKLPPGIRMFREFRMRVRIPTQRGEENDD